MVLVTGGTGFLGAYMIRELVEKGRVVRAIRHHSPVPFFMPPGIAEKVEWIEGDILDPMGLEEAMEGVDAVIHAAAKVSFAGKDRKELIHINIEGTANLVNAALSKNIRRFIHVSSVAALGRTANGERVTEEKKWEDSRLNTTYSISKYYAEIEVWRGIGEGLSAVIVNPSTLLGYGDWNETSCAIFRNVYNEFPWYTEGVNGFVDVSDAARAIVALLESDIVGQRFILNGDNWTFRKLFDTIAAALGKKQPTREATPLLAAAAWRVERIKSLFTGRPSLLTRESSRVAQSKTFFENGKILRQLPGFSFTPLEQTIRDACRDYLAQQDIAIK
ncbi:MAG TPA: NAD-dependent epimerase/dehydratase family protein [Puia sp.]|nr:NAD-dependent epimerase/dehydratase family protein [Puia sp.]